MLRRNEKIIALLLFICGMWMLPVAITGLRMDTMPGDLGDTRFNNYLLEHGHRFLNGQEKEYWNAPFFYPEPEAITYADNLLGALPFYSVPRWLGAAPDTALQVWVWLMFALNFGAAYYALFRFTGNPLAAALGAYLFTFSLPVAAQLNHIQLLPRFCFPLALYWLYKFLDSPQFRTALLLSLMLVWQFYCTMYMGFMLLLSMLVVTVVYLTLKGWKKAGSTWMDYSLLKKIAIPLLLSVVLIAPLLLPYLSRSAQMGDRNWEEVWPLLPQVRSYFLPTDGAVLWDWMRPANIKKIAFSWEHALFPGIIAFLTTGWAVWFLFRQRTHAFAYQIGFFLLCFVGLLVLTLRVGDYTLYKAVAHLPGFGSMRGVTRVILAQLFFLALLLALGYVWLSARWGKKSLWFGGLLALLLVADQSVWPGRLVNFAKEEGRSRVEPLAARIREGFDPAVHKAVVYMPVEADNASLIQIDGMLAGQSCGVPTVNGYSSATPEFYGNFIKYHNEAGLREWLWGRGILADSATILRVY